jgi:hypothetical protein
MDNTISGRRLAGFMLLALLILVGTLAFGFAASPGETPSASDTPSPSARATTRPATPAASAVVADPTSNVPVRVSTIPPFVPIPSGPNPQAP